MNKIKFGSIEYFTLRTLQDKLRSRTYDQLGLINLDKLRDEIDNNVKVIDLKESERRNNSPKTYL